MTRRFLHRIHHWMALLGLAMKDDDPLEVRDPDRQWGPPADGLILSAKTKGRRLSIVIKNAGMLEFRERIPGWLFFYRLTISGNPPLTNFGKHAFDPERNERQTELVLTPGKAIEAEIPLDSLYDLRGARHEVSASCDFAGRHLVSNEVVIA